MYPLVIETVGYLFPKGNFQEQQILLTLQMLYNPCGKGSELDGKPLRAFCGAGGGMQCTGGREHHPSASVLGYPFINLRVCLNTFRKCRCWYLLDLLKIKILLVCWASNCFSDSFSLCKTFHGKFGEQKPI